MLASSGTPRTVRITRGKKLRKNVFFLARGASKLFSDDRTKIRATVTCRARVLFSSPLAVSESPTRETPLHPARLPPSSRARRHVRAHRANVSRESSNEHARALPRAPSPRSTGATFFGVSPKFSGRPRGRDDGSHPHPSRRRQLAARRGRCLGTPHREVRHRPRGGRSPSSAPRAASNPPARLPGAVPARRSVPGMRTRSDTAPSPPPSPRASLTRENSTPAAPPRPLPPRPARASPSSPPRTTEPTRTTTRTTTPPPPPTRHRPPRATRLPDLPWRQ